MIFNQENEPIRFSNKLSVVLAFKPGIGFSNLDQQPNSSQQGKFQQAAIGCATQLVNHVFGQEAPQGLGFGNLFSHHCPAKITS